MKIFLNDLPIELIFLILNNLDSKDIVNYKYTSTNSVFLAQTYEKFLLYKYLQCAHLADHHSLIKECLLYNIFPYNYTDTSPDPMNNDRKILFSFKTKTKAVILIYSIKAKFLSLLKMLLN
jgi:hypothetical protein